MSTNSILTGIGLTIDGLPDNTVSIDAIAADTDAMSTSLGADMAGTLGGKLDAILAQLEANVIPLSGAAWPSAPTEGQRFYNTTFRTWATFNGIAHWLGDPETVSIPATILPPYIGAAPTTIGVLPAFDTELYKVTRVDFAIHILATNNGSNYWTYGLLDSANVTVYSVTTAALPQATWTQVAADLDVDSTFLLYLRLFTKTGAPGGIYLTATVARQHYYEV